MVVFTELRVPRNLFILFSSAFIIQLSIGFYFSGIMTFLFIFRLIQYLLLGYGFFLLMTSKYRSSFLIFFLFIQFIICLFQYLLIIPNYDPGRGILYSQEFSGSFGTPAEFSYFLISLVSIFMGLKFLQHILFIIPPFFSGVMFATFLMFISAFKRLINFVPKAVMIIAPYILLMALISYFVDIEIIKNVILDPGFESNSLTKGESLNAREMDGPTTLLMRATKFIDAFLYIINNLFILLFGCGYGCGLGAMDSGIVRLILEFGIVFSALIFFLSRYVTKYILFILIAVNFLFDAFWSSHVAPILFAGIFYNLVLNKTL